HADRDQAPDGEPFSRRVRPLHAYRALQLVDHGPPFDGHRGHDLAASLRLRHHVQRRLLAHAPEYLDVLLLLLRELAILLVGLLERLAARDEEVDLVDAEDEAGLLRVR